MKTPSVSVVLPTYNRRTLAAEAVASVLSQTYTDLELIVVDDGSSDGTAEHLEARHAGDERLHVVRQDNRGTADARNAGLARARAPWTAFLDSDDLWRPEYLASQLAVLATRPDADMVLGDVEYVNQGRGSESLFADPTFLAPLSLSDMVEGGWGLPSAIVIRTRIAAALTFRPRYRIVEDTDFLLRFHVAGHTCVLNPECLAVWRRPELDGAPSKTDEALELELETIRLLADSREVLEGERGLARRFYGLHKSIAQRLVRQGQLGPARRHLLAWWWGRPLRVRPFLLYLRSLMA